MVWRGEGERGGTFEVNLNGDWRASVARTRGSIIRDLSDKVTNEARQPRSRGSRVNR
jgi:hypothetical protein